jgi:hypothetical protein
VDQLLADGRRVKFTNEKLMSITFITAQVEGNKIVHSVVLTEVTDPLSCEEVEKYFDGELSKK